MGSKIKELVLECDVFYNEVTKKYAKSGIYGWLQKNINTDECYDIDPRLGSFEISLNGTLIFSKLKTKSWGNLNRIASKCQKAAYLIDHPRLAL